METQFSAETLTSSSGRRANEILRRCVHCGLCNATCPTYQLLGDELDGPRGRIYLIKSLLEAPDPSRAAVAQTHLDRCLTCRACETTCPASVAYGELLEIGRDAVQAQARHTPWQWAMRRWLAGGKAAAGRSLSRGPLQQLMRLWLGRVAPSIRWFPRWAALGRALRWALPARLRANLPKGPSVPSSSPNRLRRMRPASAPDAMPAAKPSSRRALLLQGCVQREATPEVSAAIVRFFNSQGVETLFAEGEGCCGALNLHLGQTRRAHEAMRRNLDALTPLLDRVEWVVSSASGCGVTVKDYGRLLADDPDYAPKASRLAGMARDLAEVAAELVGNGASPSASIQDQPQTTAQPGSAAERRMPPPQLGAKAAASREDSSNVPVRPPQKVAWHPPCTLQHGQGLGGLVEGLLTAAGYELVTVRDAHLCCGSAGTYSLLQPELAERLRRNKLANLTAAQPDLIATANVGCQMHLAAAADRPVLHWIQLLAHRPNDELC